MKYSHHQKNTWEVGRAKYLSAPLYFSNVAYFAKVYSFNLLM